MEVLYRLKLRFRLWRVCKKLGFRPYKWQKSYALDKPTDMPNGRGNGKSAAVMLWALIRNVKTPRDIVWCSIMDPDVSLNHKLSVRMWVDEYMRMAQKVGLRVGYRNIDILDVLTQYQIYHVWKGE